jgi:hypothetical protein
MPQCRIRHDGLRQCWTTCCLIRAYYNKIYPIYLYIKVAIFHDTIVAPPH